MSRSDRMRHDRAPSSAVGHDQGTDVVLAQQGDGVAGAVASGVTVTTSAPFRAGCARSASARPPRRLGLDVTHGTRHPAAPRSSGRCRHGVRSGTRIGRSWTYRRRAGPGRDARLRRRGPPQQRRVQPGAAAGAGRPARVAPAGGGAGGYELADERAEDRWRHLRRGGRADRRRTRRDRPRRERHVRLAPGVLVAGAAARATGCSRANAEYASGFVSYAAGRAPARGRRSR